MTSDDEILKEARAAIEEGNKEQGAKLLLAYASRLATKTEYEQAAKIYEESALVFKDLYDADEAFLTNSVMEIMPLVSVNGKPIGAGIPGKITGQLMIEYSKLVERELAG